MVFVSKQLKVIKVLHGDGTGDRKVLTDDGTVWKMVSHLSPDTRGTGDRRGYLIGNVAEEI